MFGCFQCGDNLKATEDIAPNAVHVAWQVIQYFLMTCGEVMFSVTGLDFSYAQVWPRFQFGSKPQYSLPASVASRNGLVTLTRFLSGSKQYEVRPPGGLAVDCSRGQHHRAHCSRGRHTSGPGMSSFDHRGSKSTFCLRRISQVCVLLQWAEYVLFASLLVAVSIIFSVMAYFYTYIDPMEIEATFVEHEPEDKKKKDIEMIMTTDLVPSEMKQTKI